MNPESLRSGLRFAQLYKLYKPYKLYELYKLLPPAIIVAHRIPSIADETMPPA